MKARILISYHFARTWDLDRMIEQSGCEAPDLWFDSGAFSSFTQGVTIDLDAFCDWLVKWDHLGSAACVLDVIGDAVGTMRNLERMESKGLHPLPVYHMRSERWDLFDHICDNYGHACLGGMAGTGTPPRLQLRFLVHAMRRARDRGSNIVWHTLGMTSDMVLNNVPIYSSDCSTWASARRWGYLQVWDPDAQSMRDVRVRSAEDLGKAGPLLRDHGFYEAARLIVEKAPSQAGATDTRRHKGRIPAPTRSYPVMDGLAAVAFTKREAWIRRRIGPVPRPDQPDAEPGLRLYMSASSTDQVTNLMRGCALVDDPFGPSRPLPTGLEWRARERTS